MGGLCSCYLGSLPFTKRSASVNLHLTRPLSGLHYLAAAAGHIKPKRFWQQQLGGVRAPTSLVVDRPPDSLVSQEESYAEQQIQLSAAATAALQSLARSIS